MFNKTKLIKILPGLFLSVTVSCLATLIAKFFPTLGAGTISILLGIVLGNIVFKQPTWLIGEKWAEKWLLELSIVLLGMSVTFQTLANIGLSGVLFILSQMTLTILFVYIIGRRLAFNQNMSLLMAGGNAVCGSSAIGAISPVIGAKEEEKGQVITLVNLLGTVMMLLLPLLATQLYTNDVMKQSALIGGVLQSVGQVIASASMIGTDIVAMATIFKILRIICLILVVFSFSRFTQSKQPIKKSQEKKLRLPFPWYIFGFILFCSLNSLTSMPSFLKNASQFISHWFEITALAAIGLKINAKQFIKEGPRFIIYALSVGIVQIILAVTLIYIFKP